MLLDYRTCGENGSEAFVARRGPIHGYAYLSSILKRVANGFIMGYYCRQACENKYIQQRGESHTKQWQVGQKMYSIKRIRLVNRRSKLMYLYAENQSPATNKSDQKHILYHHLGIIFRNGFQKSAIHFYKQLKIF